LIFAFLGALGVLVVQIVLAGGSGLRIDLYLKLIGVSKTRMAAKRLCDNGKILLGGKNLKPSHELEGGEILDVLLPFKEIKLQVTAIPPAKSVSKQDRAEFFQIESTKEI
jgi:ribosomal 50S subunit-recycling heat shock protein